MVGHGRHARHAHPRLRGGGLRRGLEHRDEGHPGTPPVGDAAPPPAGGAARQSRHRPRRRHERWSATTRRSSPCFRRFRGSWEPCRRPIAPPGRSCDAIFGAEGISERPKHRSLRKKSGTTVFCSVPTFWWAFRGVLGRNRPTSCEGFRIRNLGVSNPCVRAVSITR